MSKQEFWNTNRGKTLSDRFICTRGEFQAAVDSPEDAPAPVSVYRQEFAYVCMDIADALTHIDPRSSRYYRNVAASYGYTR